MKTAHKKKILIVHMSRPGDMIQSLPAVRLFVSAETEPCNFPPSAVRFAERYDSLGKMLDSFRSRLAGTNLQSTS